MKLSLIICTYMRARSLMELLISVNDCNRKPDEIIIVDGSVDNETREIISNADFPLLQISYYKVGAEDRGLTRQRNFGINKVKDGTEITSFLDDDITVTSDYFAELLKTYEVHPEAVGVGGMDLQENTWKPVEQDRTYNSFDYFVFDNWVTKEPLRYKLRKLFGLMYMGQPGLIPKYSHGRSLLPPNGKTYSVDHFMGGIASYKTGVLKDIKFSNFFEGYGLYEDFDFTVRASRLGPLFINTAAGVYHHHHPDGRPNQYKFGKMVVRNGWYVWRLKHKHPGFLNVLRWHLITLLLAQLRLINGITTSPHLSGFSEWAGRMNAWLSLLILPPKINDEPIK